MKTILEIMELIYNYPSQFAGKRISYKGFVYNSKREESVDQFVFRFGIIHCVADSGVLACWFIFLNILNFKTMIG